MTFKLWMMVLWINCYGLCLKHPYITFVWDLCTLVENTSIRFYGVIRRYCTPQIGMMTLIIIEGWEQLRVMNESYHNQTWQLLRVMNESYHNQTWPPYGIFGFLLGIWELLGGIHTKNLSEGFYSGWGMKSRILYLMTMNMGKNKNKWSLHEIFGFPLGILGTLASFTNKGCISGPWWKKIPLALNEASCFWGPWNIPTKTMHNIFMGYLDYN